jgi:hypothetical protein
MRYYHVVSSCYRQGEDLLSWNELKALGRKPPWKWPVDYDCKHVVSLFRGYYEALSYRQEHSGTILVVWLPDKFEREHLRPNHEKLPSVRDRIPAKYIQGPSDDAGFPIATEHP